MLRCIFAAMLLLFDDAAQAHDWYVKAAELGSTEANDRLNELASQNR